MSSGDGARAHAETMDWGAVHAAVNLLAGKWILVVLRELARGPRRHNELRKTLGEDITDKVLTRALRRMESGGVVTREVTTTAPPGVWYQLTPLGQSLLEPLGTIASRWREQQRTG